MKFCSVAGCGVVQKARGLCGKHLWRLYNYGTVEDPTPTAEQRFLAKLATADANGCRVWLGATARGGYGKFRSHGQDFVASRWAYEHFVGPIAPGLYVCHRCDNRPCCEPSHLFVGTQSDNIVDCVTKGRFNSPNGEAHYSAKLTERSVREIRRLAAGGAITQTEIGRRFEIDASTVSLIVRRKRWGNVS